MKRILSIILCVAMLASMVSMTVYGAEYGTQSDQVTTKNVMTFTTDKESYKPGDSVAIKVAMESIWGDPTLVDYIEGYEDYVMAGAYGMNILCSTLIYDKTVFTAKAHTDLLPTSTIANAQATDVSLEGNNPIEAKTNGAYYLMAVSDTFNADYDGYGFFTGSGDLYQYNLTISADATPGTYYLPVGPYVITDEETGASQGKPPVIKFADDKEGRVWSWLGNVDSYFVDQPVEYKTNYTGGSRISADYADGAKYECSYVVIEIEGDYTDEDYAAADAVIALIDEIGTVYRAGEVTKLDAINNNGIYTHIANVSGDTFTVSFKMMPNGAGETYGFLGGVTSMNSDNDARLFWNGAEKKFQIAKTNSWMNSSEVTSVLAESAVMDLPENKWTDVQFVYAGSNLSIVVNGETVCSTTCDTMPYEFYIFYPSQVGVYLKDAVVTGPFGTDNMHNYFTHAAFSTVTLDSGEAITAARTAYDALTATQQTLVTNYATLTAAEAEYAAIADYDNQMAANKAIALIDAIGTVSYPASGDAIVAAEEYCATLTETQLALVTNYDTLTAARAEYDRREGLYNQAKADEVIALIDAIGTVTFESREAIETAEDAYAALNDAQKALVTNYDVLVAARDAYNLYGPIMNAENLINAIGTEFYQGIVIHQNCTTSSGYANLPDQDGDNILYEFEFELDFMYASARTDLTSSSNINVIRGSKSNAGYDFKNKCFYVGNEGGWMNSSNGPTEIYASAEYELVPGRWYNLAYNWTAEGVVTLSLDGVEVLTCDLASVGGDYCYDDVTYGYAIFYPQNVDLYVGDYSHSSVRWGYQANPLQNAGYGSGGVDVLAPVNVVAKIEAAEAAVAALTAEQAALLDASYTDALTAARAAVDPLYAELVAAAADVDALIAAITDEASIDAAQAAYAALLPGAKTLVTKYADLEAANAGLVIAEIDALGTITPASANAIAAAEASYGALTANEKALVTNYAVLEAARNELNALNAAVANAEAKIALLQAGGSAIKSVVGNYDYGYSQFLDKAEVVSGGNNPAPYSFSFDVLVESFAAVATEVTLADETTASYDVAYIGGATESGIFVGYDLANSKFVIANAGPFEGSYVNVLAGKNTVYAEAAYDLALNTWYDLEFVIDDTYAEIIVDGESVVKAEVPEPTGWFIYYPVNNTAVYDNVSMIYNGVEESAFANFTKAETTNWVGVNGDGYHVISDAPAGAVKLDNDLIAVARAAYDAVPEKAQYAVSNYAILTEAEANAPVVDPNAEAAAEVDAQIAAIGDVTLDSEAAITAARAAYDALSDEAKALVTELATLEAAEATLADLKKAAADQAAADAVDAEIAAIGEVTLDSEAAITAARAAYDALTDDQKALVAELATLEAAEAALADLKQAAVDQAAADAVQAKIDALNVPATTYKNYADVLAAEAALVDAKTSYDALTDAQKALVDTTALDAALKAYNKALIYNSVLNNATVAPANVAAIGGEGEITVTWDAVETGVKYWVYVDGAVVATTKNTEITVPASAGDHTVKVAVAVNATPELGSAATYVSGTSDEVSVTVAEYVAPEVTVSADATENSITASWNAVADNAIYYVNFNVGGTDIMVKTKNTTFTLSKYVTASTAYTVTVQAFIPNGDGTYEVITSEVAEGVTAAPSFQVVYNGETITWTAVEGATIYWSQVTDANGKTITTRYNAVTEIKAPATAGEYDVKITAYAAGKYFYAVDSITVEA